MATGSIKRRSLVLNSSFLGWHTISRHKMPLEPHLQDLKTPSMFPSRLLMDSFGSHSARIPRSYGAEDLEESHWRGVQATQLGDAHIVMMDDTEMLSRCPGSTLQACLRKNGKTWLPSGSSLVSRGTCTPFQVVHHYSPRYSETCNGIGLQVCPLRRNSAQAVELKPPELSAC